MSQTSESVVELLRTLRNERFSLKAWWHFFRRSWELSCETARANPTLKRSWARITLLMGMLVLIIYAASFSLEGPGVALRLLPGFLFCVGWQQSDLFWHLGLVRNPQTGKILPVIGMANTLTALRGLAASFLFGRLIGGIPVPVSLALPIFLGGVVTDICDGRIARYTATQSRLGQIADGEADFCLYLAITIILIQNGLLAPWFELVVLLRFLMPFCAALASYFLFACPVRFGSTNWGRFAGLAQCLYFLALLTPGQLAFLTHLVNFPLLLVTLFLLIAAPLAQIAGYVTKVGKSA